MESPEQEIIVQLEDLMDLEASSLTPEMKLNEIPEFDSMVKLSLIVMSDDDFDKKLTAEQINDFRTIADIINFLK